MKQKIKIVFAAFLLIAVVVSAGVYLNGKSVQVVIDPGHGGDDVGAVHGERYEKDDNLALALLVNKKLREMEIETAMTRKRDKKVSLEKRCEFANKKEAD